MDKKGLDFKLEIEANKLATKIYKVQEYILEEIKEKGEISDFKEDVMYVIHNLLEKQLSKEEQTACEIVIRNQSARIQIEKEKHMQRKIKQLKTDKQKLIEELEEKEKLNDKYLQKLVHALSPTTHDLGDSYNNAFKKIIADNIDLETCKIKRELKDLWEGRF